ncbi:MAG: hypothetical protein ABJE10_02320 [bacterium]
MTERRFNEAEVAAIFERASELRQPGQRQPSADEGLTLAELQDIGREVGIPADSIVLAAQTVGQSGPLVSRTLLGFPVGVTSTVNLGRKLSDDEWEQVVVDLRETFNARGTVRSQGSLREWTNGNLQVMLEPTATGHRLRFRTVKGDAKGWLVGGLGFIGGAATIFAVAALRGALGDPGLVQTLMGGAAWGAGMFATGAIGLPRWARTRQRQMNEIAARVALATTTSTSD